MKKIDKEIPKKIILFDTLLKKEKERKEKDFASNIKSIYIAMTVKDVAYDYKVIKMLQKIHTTETWECSLQTYRKSTAFENTFIYVWTFTHKKG